MMNLTETIKKMQDEPEQANNKAFADFFRSMVDGNVQVFTSAKPSGTGYAIDTAEHTGNVYCIMYSDSSMVAGKNGSKVCTIGLSNLIDSAYANPHIAGIAINPGSERPVYIQRKDLQIISGKQDPRLKSRDWGKGIPEYSEADIMVAEEAIEFAMEIVAQHGIAPEGYSIIETNNGLTAFPNFVCMKDTQLFFIAVDVAVAPRLPSLKPDVVPKMLKIADENHAKVLYAPVSFGSADPERMQAGLALSGDEFIGNFAGFIPLN